MALGCHTTPHCSMFVPALGLSTLRGPRCFNGAEKVETSGALMGKVWSEGFGRPSCWMTDDHLGGSASSWEPLNLVDTGAMFQCETWFSIQKLSFWPFSMERNLWNISHCNWERSFLMFPDGKVAFCRGLLPQIPFLPQVLYPWSSDTTAWPTSQASWQHAGGFIISLTASFFFLYFLCVFRLFLPFDFSISPESWMWLWSCTHSLAKSIQGLESSGAMMIGNIFKSELAE